MSKKAKKTGGLYSNRNDYFQKGKSPSLDADKQNYAGELQDGYSYVAHQDSPDPVAFTQSRTARKGGGFDYGEKQYIYKKVEPKEAPVQQAPAPEAVVEEEEVANIPIQLSNTAAEAIAGSEAYEDYLLPGQGDYTINGDLSPVQEFKDNYQLNLTELLKTDDPSTLASKKAEIEIADQQKAGIENSYVLDLGQN